MSAPEVEPGDAPRDPRWQRMYDHCATKPDAVEDHPWGETVFKIGGKEGKIFAFLGMGTRAAVGVKSDPDELEALLSMPFIERSPYIGRYGWVTVTAADDAGLELALELIDTSYELIRKPKKRMAARAIES